MLNRKERQEKAVERSPNASEKAKEPKRLAVWVVPIVRKRLDMLRIQVITESQMDTNNQQLVEMLIGLGEKHINELGIIRQELTKTE